MGDLTIDEKLHPDNAKRNEEMVRTIKSNLTDSGRVFVIAGALHLPHYEFASTIKLQEELDAAYPAVARMPFLATPGAKKDTINLSFYDYWGRISQRDRFEKHL